MKILIWMVYLLGIGRGYGETINKIDDFSNNDCLKGIKCLNSTAFVLCNNNYRFFAIGKKIHTCSAGQLCSESNPERCLAELPENKLIEEDIEIELQIDYLENQGAPVVSPSKPDFIFNIHVKGFPEIFQSEQVTCPEFPAVSTTIATEKINLTSSTPKSTPRPTSPTKQQTTPSRPQPHRSTTMPSTSFRTQSELTTRVSTVTKSEAMSTRTSKPILPRRPKIRGYQQYYIEFFQGYGKQELKTYAINVKLDKNGLAAHIPSHERYDRIAMVGQHLHTLTKEYFGILQPENKFVMDIVACEILKVKPGAFSTVRNMRGINLSSNNITTIEKGIFNDLLFEEVDLKSNNIYLIWSNAFDNMPNLKLIDLSLNKLHVYDMFWFKNTPNLVNLRFGHNKIHIIPAFAFQNLNLNKEIEILLDHNEIYIVDYYAFFRNGADAILGFKYLDTLKIKKFILKANLLACVFETAFPATFTSLAENKLTCDCLKIIKRYNDLHKNKVIKRDEKTC